MENTFIMKSEKDTEKLAREFAKGLRAGDVVALVGDLGAGKTTFTKAAAEGLGVTEKLSSPTFTIVCEYESGRLPLYHFDVYRVNDEDELFEIGFDDYLHGKGVCLIEWANLVEDLLPENTIYVNLSYGSSENERIINIKC